LYNDASGRKELNQRMFESGIKEHMKRFSLPWEDALSEKKTEKEN